MKKPEKINVKITHSYGWYKKGEVHEVNNYITFGYHREGPHFEVNDGQNGIALSDCEIIKPDPEYTLKELYRIIGHKFKIVNHEKIHNQIPER